jgi:hypothetical protein
VAGSVPVLHPEAQTVDEMLRVGVISNCAATWLMARSRGAAGCARRDQTDATTDQQRTRLPMSALELTMPVTNSRVRLRRVYFQPGRAECPSHPANTAGSNMEGYRYSPWRREVSVRASYEPPSARGTGFPSDFAGVARCLHISNAAARSPSVDYKRLGHNRTHVLQFVVHFVLWLTPSPSDPMRMLLVRWMY